MAKHRTHHEDEESYEDFDARMQEKFERQMELADIRYEESRERKAEQLAEQSINHNSETE